jgi:hypothetical protein|tara:strand:+ start:722 stop:1096 length:375 start_codon:yes stop_codon:yes gene_type:complete
MKWLLVLLLLPLNMLAQDTIQMPRTDLDEIFLAIDTLMEQDSTKTILIEELEYQLVNYKTLAQHDSTLLLYKGQEIELLNEQIELYIDRLDVVDKWYNRPWIGVVGGVVGTIALIHVIDYSLPQ